MTIAREPVATQRGQMASIAETEIRVKGKPVAVPSVQIDGRVVIVKGRLPKIASVQDEDMMEGEIVEDAPGFIQRLKNSRLDADIFTFAQKIDDPEPKHPYHYEWDNFAVVPITTYAHWWEKQVEPSVRRAVRKAEKLGVTVRLAQFDDEFVRGIVSINDEAPIRQGKPFWHYQKPFDAVKLENGTYGERNLFIGAYLADELIGYIRMTRVDRGANIIQQLSMMKHYDKRTANALMAKAVETCADMGLSHLIYCNYVYNDPNSSLTEFKRRNGFQKVLVPRYFVPLSNVGKIALKLGMHRTLAQWLPQPLVVRLLNLRNKWYARRGGKDAE